MLDVGACASQGAWVQTESKGARNGNIRNATNCKVRKGCPELNLRNATKCYEVQSEEEVSTRDASD